MITEIIERIIIEVFNSTIGLLPTWHLLSGTTDQVLTYYRNLLYFDVLFPVQTTVNIIFWCAIFEIVMKIVKMLTNKRVDIEA